MQRKNNDAIALLCRALSRLESPEEVALFLEDLCTLQELDAMSQRFEVACYLDSGMSYNDINSKTTMSTATISRVNRCINYGEGGYRLAIEKIKND